MKLGLQLSRCGGCLKDGIRLTEWGTDRVASSSIKVKRGSFDLQFLSLFNKPKLIFVMIYFRYVIKIDMMYAIVFAQLEGYWHL
jgi:hypothetical protein